jgi:hypothetical protein
VEHACEPFERGFNDVVDISATLSNYVQGKAARSRDGTEKFFSELRIERGLAQTWSIGGKVTFVDDKRPSRYVNDHLDGGLIEGNDP